MSTPEPDLRVRPSARWYLLPIGIFVACVIIVFFAFKPLLDLVGQGIDPVRNGAQVTVPVGGITVYSQDENVSRDCALVDDSGSASALKAFETDVNLDPPNSPGYQALASTPEGFSAGAYLLQCPQADAGARLGLGARLDIESLSKRATVGVLVSLAAGLIGLMILIVLLVKRHNSKSRRRLAAPA